jgi:UDP-galactopyranose mutase
MVLIVGAGFSGAVIANILAKKNIKTMVIDKRNHIGGNCHTERDIKTNVMVHRYGPHIFHTDSSEVWNYINSFGEMMNYTNRVKSVSNNRLYSMPINLSTINQFYNKNLSPVEAKSFISNIADSNISNPQNFEEQGMKFIGKELYNAFLKGYTEKQWGMDPKKIPASVLKRLPVRFNFNDNYFFHKYQGIPKNGYTKIIKSILNHPLIEVRLNTNFSDINIDSFEYVFFAGPVDEFFNYKLGNLEYRTLDFEEQHHCCNDFQGTAVINYGDRNVPYTRISEHKHFAPWEYENTNGTVVYREYSRKFSIGDIEYYPIRLASGHNLIEKYNKLALASRNVSFVGRLGTYRYLDMDVTILEAMKIAKQFVNLYSCGGIQKVYSHREQRGLLV